MGEIDIITFTRNGSIMKQNYFFLLLHELLYINNYIRVYQYFGLNFLNKNIPINSYFSSLNNYLNS